MARLAGFLKGNAMAQHASAETCISVSAAKPATNDEAGFDALSFTQVGELESIGDITRRKTAINFANLCTGKTTILKGGEEGISVQVSVALDRDDAGQTLMTAAYDATEPYSFKITESNGDIVYFQAYVMEDSIRYGDINSVVKGGYQLGLLPETFVVKTA